MDFSNGGNIFQRRTYGKISKFLLNLKGKSNAFTNNDVGHEEMANIISFNTDSKCQKNGTIEVRVINDDGRTMSQEVDFQDQSKIREVDLTRHYSIRKKKIKKIGSIQIIGFYAT